MGQHYTLITHGSVGQPSHVQGEDPSSYIEKTVWTEVHPCYQLVRIERLQVSEAALKERMHYCMSSGESDEIALLQTVLGGCHAVTFE